MVGTQDSYWTTQEANSSPHIFRTKGYSLSEEPHEIIGEPLRYLSSNMQIKGKKYISMFVSVLVIC